MLFSSEICFAAIDPLLCGEKPVSVYVEKNDKYEVWMQIKFVLRWNILLSGEKICSPTLPSCAASHSSRTFTFLSTRQLDIVKLTHLKTQTEPENPL